MEKDETGRAERSSNLIPLLQSMQEKFGYLPEGELTKLSEDLNVPVSRIYGVATFYTQFKFEPLGKYIVRICHGTACHVNGANKISELVCERLGLKEGETSPDRKVTLERVACLGCCSLSPVIMVNDRVFGKLDLGATRKILDRLERGELDD